ncbi:hypothetical protein BKA70DRAFT_1453542 [Coprinopsis sp. MPI-PUGE-AT-0042]|nr:hypothetical protein BKA70DRAFT_1453542 [Coprinopsis sp. MPI-PUGE-AT-0042]
MSFNNNTSRNTPCLPPPRRRLVIRPGSPSGPVLASPFSMQRSASDGAQTTMLPPVSALLAVSASSAANGSFPEALSRPVLKRRRTDTTSNNALDPSVMGSPTPRSNSRGSGVNPEDPRSPWSGILEYTDPSPPVTPPPGPHGSAKDGGEGAANPPSPMYSPGTRTVIRNEKRASVPSPRLRSPYDAVMYRVTISGQTSGWTVGGSSSGSTTESDSASESRVALPDYIVPDSDQASSSTTSSSSKFTTPPEVPAQADGSFVADSEASVFDNVDSSVENMIELDRIPKPPSVSSVNTAEYSEEPRSFVRSAPLGRTPPFMQQPSQAATWGTPISIRSSSEDSAEQPSFEHQAEGSRHVQRKAPRLEGARAPFREKELGTSLARNIKMFDPALTPTLLLFNVAHPGPGITEKELASILCKCKECKKCLYIPHSEEHFCDKLALAKIHDPDFKLGRYLSNHSKPVIGIATFQFKEVFVRCDDCDRIFWRRKVDEHICPRYQ